MRVKNMLFARLRLKEIELGRRIDITEVSRDSGVTRATLHAWLRNPYLARFEADTVTRLCAYFECGLDDLLVLEDERQAG